MVTNDQCDETLLSAAVSSRWITSLGIHRSSLYGYTKMATCTSAD
jgi:hypothetical protein